MRTHRDHNRYMAEYMRQYRKRKAEERQAAKGQEQDKLEALLTGILETLGRIERALTKPNIKAATPKPANISKLTETNVKSGKPTAERSIKRGSAVFTSEPEQANVNINGDGLMELSAELRALIQSPGDSPARRAALAKEAQALHQQGLSYERIAERWTEERKPTLKGRKKWHKGTIAKMIQRHT